MAMLAEPRRKQKYSVDPRGSNWSNDDSKFGQKLLEKFGWKKGKGLGAKEDGKTEHVKVSVKSDHKGVGCSQNHADNWIAHQDDFNALLANLNQSSAETGKNDSADKVSSLEARSKTSRARVHYQKFTKGKDLSAKSLQDLDCVFGVRKTKSEPSSPQCQSEENSDCDDGLDENQRETPQSGLNTIKSADSVQEYFAKKMAELKKSRSNQPGAVEDRSCENSNQLNNLNDGTTDKMNKKVKFSIESSSSSENDEENRKTKKTKKRKAKDSDDSKTVTKKSKKKKQDESDDTIKQIQEVNSQTDPSVKKSKKKKDKKEKSKAENRRSEEQGNKVLSSPESESEQNIDTLTEEPTDIAISKKKKNKKKKKKDEDNENDDDDISNATSSAKSNRSDVKENKTDLIECNQDESENKQSEDIVSIKKKKSKKRKKNNDDLESDMKSCDKSGNSYVDNSDSPCGEPGCKRKKKSKDNVVKEKNSDRSKDNTEISADKTVEETDKNIDSSVNCVPGKKLEDGCSFDWKKKHRTKTCEKVKEKFGKKGSNISSIKGYNFNNDTGLM